MIANKDKVQCLLNAKKLSNKDFARMLNIEHLEADKLISGERVGYETARKFIYFLKADIAQHYIDWEKLGVQNPLKENKT